VRGHPARATPLDLTSPPGGGTILPGTTLELQAWFRDPAAGGSFFNLTNALTLRIE